MEIGHVPGLRGGVDGLIEDPAPNGLPGYAFNAYLVKMLDVPQYSIGTSTAVMDITADTSYFRWTAAHTTAPGLPAERTPPPHTRRVNGRTTQGWKS
jgi:hypothetical protein